MSTVLFDPKSQDYTKNLIAVDCCATSQQAAHTEGKRWTNIGLKKCIIIALLCHYCDLITNLREILTHHSKIPRRAENKYDLCWQGSGTKVIWHFCCYSDGKYYIMLKCCSLWQATYQCKGSKQHSIGAQVLVSRREQGICMSWFPFQTSSAASWSTCPELDQFPCLPVKWGRNRKFFFFYGNYFSVLFKILSHNREKTTSWLLTLHWVKHDCAYSNSVFCQWFNVIL